MVVTEKKLKDFARKLLQMSIEDGQVSGERSRAVLDALAAKPPKQHRKILQLYLQYVRRELRKSQAIVEYAGEIDEKTVRNLEKEFSNRTGRKITAITRENPKLIGGLRLTLGDNIYNFSLSGHLENLARSVH